MGIIFSRGGRGGFIEITKVISKTPTLGRGLWVAGVVGVVGVSYISLLFPYFFGAPSLLFSLLFLSRYANRPGIYMFFT